VSQTRRVTFRYRRGDLVRIAHDPTPYRVVQQRATIRQHWTAVIEYALVPDDFPHDLLRWEAEGDLQALEVLP
jgi:hypothetical protein